ncbi:hypothetical protein MNBD_GAMMA10-1382 [hydrothermal vent metagenome]|uniref:Uncharacterized protein n=1 Tax=hydrothermal vent metagenome TaxID=652676 RepID=A0A3B0XVX7_9ZZZZ
MAQHKTVNGHKFISYGSINGRRLWATEHMAPALQYLDSHKNRNYHLLYIHNCIRSLQNGTSQENSVEQIHMTDRRNCKLNMAGSELEYFMKDGATFITRLVLSGEDYDMARKDGMVAGLNRVKKNEEDEWEVKGSIDQIETKLVAVNGEAWHIDETLLFMPKMIQKAHPTASSSLTSNDEGQEGYSIFFSPCKKGTDGGWREMQKLMPARRGAEADAATRQAIVDQLSACIELAGKKSNPELHWTIQGSGSKLFCEALEQLKVRNSHLHDYGVDLSQQTVHFFNTHTNPMEIDTLINSFNKAGNPDNNKMKPGEGGLLTSTLRSKGNFNASKTGHKKHHDQKAAANKAEGKSGAAAKLEANRVSGMVHSGYKMTAKYTAFAITAGSALMNDDVYENAINLAHSVGDSMLSNPISSTIGTSALAVIATHKLIKHTAPKMYSLASLIHANITNDRRLDQLTESNSVKAAGQLYNLRQGNSI